MRILKVWNIYVKMMLRMIELVRTEVRFPVYNSQIKREKFIA